jgi:hypothetical protein
MKALPLTADLGFTFCTTHETITDWHHGCVKGVASCGLGQPFLFLHWF